MTTPDDSLPVNKVLRIVFAGTPDFAATHLSELIDSRHNVVAVYTQPDRPAGRGKKLQASPVKQVALEAGIAVMQPKSLKPAAELEALSALDADVMIVVAYGLLLPQAVLDTPRFGCLNVHGSLLPRWRGAAPIQRSIEAGDTETGITIMQMDAGLDTGAMLYKVPCTIEPNETSISLHDKLAAVGPTALLNTLDLLCNQQLKPETQNNELANYAHKLSKEEGAIDWQQSCELILRKIRAFNPFPVCYTQLNSERVRILEAYSSDENAKAGVGKVISHNQHAIHIGTGDGVIAVTTLQLPGKKAMAAQDLLNGMADKLAIGTQFE